MNYGSFPAEPLVYCGLLQMPEIGIHQARIQSTGQKTKVRLKNKKTALCAVFLTLLQVLIKTSTCTWHLLLRQYQELAIFRVELAEYIPTGAQDRAIILIEQVKRIRPIGNYTAGIFGQIIFNNTIIAGN